MNPFYQRVAGRANKRCEYCHAPEEIFNHLFEVEHIIPVAQNGTNTLENLALACRTCNLHKSDYLTGTDPETQTILPLFHPRRDLWEQHFYFNVETGLLVGLTPTGRATISRLQMNLPNQVAARRLWIQLDIFP